MKIKIEAIFFKNLLKKNKINNLFTYHNSNI
jgi:hypothetical protein